MGIILTQRVVQGRKTGTDKNTKASPNRTPLVNGYLEREKQASDR